MNVTEMFNQVSGKIMITGVQLTAKTIKFYANEKNENLSPLATEMLSWAKENGFEIVSRPIGKSKLNKNEFYQDKNQDVSWQMTSYTLK